MGPNNKSFKADLLFGDGITPSVEKQQKPASSSSSPIPSVENKQRNAESFDIFTRYNEFINKVDTGRLPYVRKERIDKNFENYGKAMNTLYMYPDIFADIMTPKDSSFSLFFEQRMVCRSMVRYRQSYYTFTRGFSKSFLAAYVKYTTCMFVPRHWSFIAAGTKKQSVSIAEQTIVKDLWVKFPLLANEMRRFKIGEKTKTPYINSGDEIKFNFTNGSILEVVGGQIRGRRMHSGLFEEVITLDPEYTNETLIPMLNTTRLNKQGRVNPNEPQGQKTFITSAGYTGTFAYDKLIETLCLSLIDPDKYIVMGGSYNVLVMHNRINEDTIREIISSPSYNADQVDREYRSIWSTTNKGAVFQSNSISEMRKIKRAEFKARDGIDKDFYVVVADLAYDGDADTAVIVIRVSPGEYRFSYRFVNLFTIDVANFETVANILKETCIRYNSRLLIYDANGVGATLREHLNKTTSTPDGVVLPSFGIINPPQQIEKQLKRVSDPRYHICYEIKSGGQKGSEIHGVFLGKMTSGAIRLLVKSSEALQYYSNVKNFALASSSVKDRYMRPYYYTDLFESELRNLDFKQDLTNENMIRVVRRDDKIQKDFFSAAEYGIYAVVQMFELPYYKNKRNLSTKKYSLNNNNNQSSSGISGRRSRQDLSSRRRVR